MRRNYSMCLRMGAADYSLEVVTSRYTLNYDLSRMTKHERKALRSSVVARVRQYQLNQRKVIDHNA